MTTIHQAAVARTQKAVSTFDTASIKHAEASVKLNNLYSRQQKLSALVQKLEGNAKADPKKYGAALADAKSKLAKLGKDLTAQREVVEGAGRALAARRADVDQAEAGALAAAKAQQLPAAFWVDSLEDAASLPIEAQKQVLGAVAYVSKEQALATDVKTVKQALASMPPDQAIKVLDRTLMGTAPREQAKLLGVLRNELEFFARAANEPITQSAHGEASGTAYVEAMRMASPAAQKLMARALADTFPGGDKWRPGLEHGWKTGAGKALGESMKSGQSFGVAAEVVTALTAAGKLDQAGTMRGVIADSPAPTLSPHGCAASLRRVGPSGSEATTTADQPRSARAARQSAPAVSSASRSAGSPSPRSDNMTAVGEKLSGALAMGAAAQSTSAPGL